MNNLKGIEILEEMMKSENENENEGMIKSVFKLLNSILSYVNEEEGEKKMERRGKIDIKIIEYFMNYIFIWFIEDLDSLKKFEILIKSDEIFYSKNFLKKIYLFFEVNDDNNNIENNKNNKNKRKENKIEIYLFFKNLIKISFELEVNKSLITFLIKFIIKYFDSNDSKLKYFITVKIIFLKIEL
jgi:hypothetical protein